MRPIVEKTWRHSQNRKYISTSQPIIDSTNACNQVSAPGVNRCMYQSKSLLLGVLGLSGTCFPQKVAPSPSEIVTPLFLGPSSLIIPNSISIGSAVFVWVPNAMLYNVLLMGKKRFKIAPSPWDFPTGGGQSHGHRQHAQTIWCILRVWFRRYPRGQTDRQTHSHTDVLITILRNRFRGRIKNPVRVADCVIRLMTTMPSWCQHWPWPMSFE